MKSDIQIRNSADVCYIDIEGTIGVPEQWQFASPDDRVATYEKFRDAGGAHRSARRPAGGGQHPLDGGDVNDALLIYDALAALDAEVTTRCYGYVASAATLIAQAASEGRREISGRGALPGARGGLRRRGQRRRAGSPRRTAPQDRRTAGRPLRPTVGTPQEEFAQRMAENNGNGRWLSPEETVAAGLADRIVEGGETAEGERSAVRNLASGWNRLLAAFGLHGAAAPAGAAREEDRRNILHLDDADPAAGRSAIEAAEGQRRHRATQVLAAEDPSVGESAARPTKRPMPPTRGSSRRGYNGGRFPKNRREDLPPNSCSAFGSSQKHKKKGMKSILTFTLGKFRSFDSAFPARSRFTTFWHRKVAPKSVRRAKNSGTGRRLAPETLRGQARARVFDGASAARSSSRFFAMRSCCALRATMIICWCLFLAVLWPARMHCFRYFRSAIRRPEAC